MPPTAGQRLAPLLLRVALGATFLWAGFGKLYADIPVKGTDAAILANMGVSSLATKPAKAPSKPADKPAEKPSDKPAAKPTKPAEGRPVPTEPLPDDGAKPKHPSLPALAVTFLAPDQPTYSADDFPDAVKVRRVYAIALVLHRGTHPAPKADGSPGMPLWPAFAGRDAWPVYEAWAVAITELAGGFFLLAGFLTRLGAVGIAGTMLGAVWLTEIGPAVQSGKAWMGILPDYPAFDLMGAPGGSYATLLWQCTLLAAALAVAMLGPGGLSMDGLLFGKAPSGPPKPPPPKPAP